MKRFLCYRPNPPAEYAGQGAANPPDEVQFEGVVFSDGTVCVRWLTAFRSHSVWASIDDMLAIHGHPEYGTQFEWLDGEIGELKKISGEDPHQEYRDALDAHAHAPDLDRERTKRIVDRAWAAYQRHLTTTTAESAGNP